EAERDVLERAAVIGLEFEWTALAELDREQRRPGGVLLAALVRKELIRPHDAIEDTFQFRHASSAMPPTSPSRRIFAPTYTNASQGGSMAGARSSTRSSATTSSRPIVPSSRSGRRATVRGHSPDEPPT